MKFLGFVLLLAGWLIAVATIAMLAAAGPRVGFVLAAIGVEILGLVLFIRAHLVPGSDRD